MRPSTRGTRHEVPVTPVAPEVSLVPVALTPVVAEAPAAIVLGDSPPTETPAPMPEVGDRITQLARERVGSPYVWGGASPLTGFDCSGLVRWVFGQIGIDVGRTVWSQYPQGEEVAADQLRPGDVVFFANTYTAGLSHVGIYVGDGQFVDAGTERTGVRQASIWDPYWAPRYVGARRLG